MKKQFLSFVLATVAFAVSAQTDVIETSLGPLTIQPIVHGTVALQVAGKTIFVDPYGGAEKFAGLDDPDLILITDIHGDHLNQKTLDGLNTSNAQFVVPKAVAEKLPEAYSAQVTVINNDEKVNWEQLAITAIPMYNLPEDETSRHTKGRGNGYILKVGQTSIYFSGDTEDIPEMRALTDIDVAFVCMNLPYTMDVKQAADAVNEFKPTIVYPYHYRGKDGFSPIDEFKSLVNASSPDVEVRIRDWYQQ